LDVPRPKRRQNCPKLVKKTIAPLRKKKQSARNQKNKPTENGNITDSLETKGMGPGLGLEETS